MSGQRLGNKKINVKLLANHWNDLAKSELFWIIKY